MPAFNSLPRNPRVLFIGCAICLAIGLLPAQDSEQTWDEWGTAQWEEITARANDVIEPIAEKAQEIRGAATAGWPSGAPVSQNQPLQNPDLTLLVSPAVISAVLGSILEKEPVIRIDSSNFLVIKNGVWRPNNEKDTIELLMNTKGQFSIMNMEPVTRDVQALVELQPLLQRNPRTGSFDFVLNAYVTHLDIKGMPQSVSRFAANMVDKELSNRRELLREDLSTLIRHRIQFNVSEKKGVLNIDPRDIRLLFEENVLFVQAKLF